MDIPQLVAQFPSPPDYYKQESALPPPFPDPSETYVVFGSFKSSGDWIQALEYADLTKFISSVQDLVTQFRKTSSNLLKTLVQAPEQRLELMREIGDIVRGLYTLMASHRPVMAMYKLVQFQQLQISEKQALIKEMDQLISTAKIRIQRLRKEFASTKIE